MKIKKLSVGSFGKLNDREFEFSDRLNIIYGKNEAGKSTLSAFMKYMLYGFSSQKGRSVDSNDKTKYTPWDTDVISGSGIIATDKGDLRIERRNGAKSSLKVTDPSGKELLYGKEPGEELFGLDEAAFSKMAFIRQNDISADKMSNLSDIVQNAVYSADETVDIEKARKKLSDYRNFYRSRTGKRGQCFELEEKVRALRYDFDKASEMHKNLLSAEAKLAETRAKIKSNEEKACQLEKELGNISGYEASLIIEKILCAKKDLEEAGEKYEAAKKRITFSGQLLSGENLELLMSANDNLSRARTKLDEAKEAFETAEEQKKQAYKNDPVFAKFSGKELPDAEEAENNVKKASSSRKTFMIFAAVAACMAIVFGVGFFAFPIPGFKSYFGIMAAAFLAIGVLFGVLYYLSSSKLSKILSSCGFENVREFEEFLQEYPRSKEKLSQVDVRCDLMSEELEKKTAEYEEARTAFDALVCRLGDISEEQDGKEVIARLKDAFDAFRMSENEYKRRESIYDTFLATNDLHALSDAAEKYTHVPERDRKTVLREYEFFKKANENLSELEKQYIRQSAAPASAIRKPSEILAERQATQALLDKATEKADAAELALEALENACADLKGGISPRIAAKAGEYFSDFTGGKYPDLEISGQFGVGITHGGIVRDSGYLSHGTRDAAYLALRLSLCENLFKEAPPLVLDEVFAYADDERLQNMLMRIVKLSEKYQIFLFTCHEREKKMLERFENVNIIEM